LVTGLIPLNLAAFFSRLKNWITTQKTIVLIVLITIILLSIFNTLSYQFLRAYLSAQEVDNATNRAYGLSVLLENFEANSAQSTITEQSLNLNKYEELFLSTARGQYLFSNGLQVEIPIDLLKLQGSAYQYYINNNTSLLAIKFPITNGFLVYVTRVQNLADSLTVLSYLFVASTIFLSLLVILITIWVKRYSLRSVRLLRNQVALLKPNEWQKISTQDIHDADVKILGDLINSLIFQLNTLVEQEKRFSANLSHELRSPLNTLVNAFEVLKARQDELPEKARQSLSLITKELDKFRQLIENLLEIARLEKTTTIDLEPINAGVLISQCLNYLEIPSDLVTLDPALFKVTILSDKRRFERVMANLIENASTHGKGLTQVSAKLLSNFLEIKIYDEGPGITTEEKDRVFERFYRSKTADNNSSSGSGLGLTLVSAYIRHFKGQIRLEDNFPSGTIVVVNIPVESINES